MKKLVCFCFGLLALALANATTYNVNVLNNQFSPANLNVKVGDIIHYIFNSGGFHNATSEGASIPAGAAEIYSGSLNSSNRTYNYSVTLPGVYNYYCEAHGDRFGDGMAGSFTATSLLPVKLKDFSISSSPSNKPVITWTTATEQNVLYFSVRSSSDGKQFVEVGKINSKGNSSSEQRYSFTDNNISANYRYLYYELVIVDRDGQLDYSPIKIYKTGFAYNKLVTQLGPNPITRPAQLMMQFNADKQGTVQVNVYDAGGRKTLRTTLAAMPGLNNGHIHVCDFKPGVYTLQFIYEGLVESRKLVVK